MKMRILIYLLLSYILVLIGNASDKQGVSNLEVFGLNEEIYYKLSGSWDRYEDITNVTLDSYRFSWGKGKLILNSSIVIDFGDKPPEFYNGFEAFDIVSITTIEQNKYKLNVMKTKIDVHTWEKYKKPGFFIIIYNDSDNTISFKNISGSFWMDPKLNPYYKISGPKR